MTPESPFGFNSPDHRPPEERSASAPAGPQPFPAPPPPPPSSAAKPASEMGPVITAWVGCAREAVRAHPLYTVAAAALAGAILMACLAPSRPR